MLLKSVLLGVVVGMALTNAMICGELWFDGEQAKSHGWLTLGWVSLAVMFLAAGLTAMSV